MDQTLTSDTAALPEVERNFLWKRQFLNASAFVDAPASLAALAG
jgi:serine/threonine-protein kinase HipA